MILQRDTRLRAEIQTAGCYYMSLLYLANKLSNCPLTIQRINANLYYRAIQEGWMSSGCFVSFPDAIMNAIMSSVTLRYTGVHEAPTYLCGPGEYEILRFERRGDYGHFVAGDGAGHVAYDPMGESRTVKEGRLISKRIFVREG